MKAGMKAKELTLQQLAEKLEHGELNFYELEEFAVRSYLNAQAWKGACIGLIAVAVLCFLAALRG